MKLRLPTVRTLFCSEMRMVLRDRRTLLTAVLLPLLVMPVMIFSAFWINQRRERTLRQTTYRYVVTGSQAAAARALVSATARRLAAQATTNRTARFKFEEVARQDATAALAKGDLHFILEGLTAEEAQDAPPDKKKPTSSQGRAPAKPKFHPDHTEVEEADETARAGVPAVRIVFRADRDDSTAGMHRMRAALRETRRAQRGAALEARHFPLPPAQVAAISEVNVASRGQVAGLTLGRVLTLFLLLFVLSSGAVVATDSLAGEKERGTLETLLTTAASRAEIIAAKHLVILAVALVVTLIQVANLLVYVGFKLIPASTHFAAAVSPLTALLLFALFLPVAALAAGVLLLTSGYAKSYKEAQLYFLPVVLLGLVPALAPFLPGLPLRSAIVLVPVANIALAVKEILIGARDWPMIALSWLVTAGAAVWTIRLGARFLSAEKLITAGETDAVEFIGGPALFGRHVLRWFALLWALILIVNNYIAAADLRLQLSINLLVLLFGASLLMIRHYRLDPRAALALRLPKPAIWLAVLFAVPGGLLTGIGLFRLANLVLPVPAKMLEGFTEALLPEHIPFVQILFFLCLLPGLFEEITFRGVLLHGLHRRLHPAALVLVVGLVFGLFHVALFRLVPTAFLGLLFASVTLLTGSIYPAMLWHALSNALSLLATQQALPLAELDPGCYLAGAGILGAAFWIFWRNRTPYPGLRPWRGPGALE